jgi:transcriptional regulator with XRE-family HTH domain
MPRRSPLPTDAGAASQVGGRIKQKRRAAGLTLEEVSDRTGISISTLSRLEHGIYQLSVPQLQALARALRCTTMDLLAERTEGGGSEGPT